MKTMGIRAGEAQKKAANPAVSAWVGANAGTGKTKVLTDRVLNLMLSGSAPERILCLTFTRAAAAEMSTRLARTLSEWAIATDEHLEHALTALLGNAPDHKTCNTARRLFARMLDVPGGMKIQTIHAFCQALLRRFPLEAGIAPHFAVMEDRDAATLMLEAREHILLAARQDETSDLHCALALVTSHVHEDAFNALMADIATHRGRLSRLLAQGMEPVSFRLAQRLGLDINDTPDLILRQAAQDDHVPVAQLKNLAIALARGGKTDLEAAERITDWLAADTPKRCATWPDYGRAFLTADGEPRSRSRFPSKAVRENNPDILETLDAETERIVRTNTRLKAAVTFRATLALLTLARSMTAEYQIRKERAGKMDFDDLILTTRRLLQHTDTAAWVLYKLDGGLDHVLIDEAQDTNPDQWAVIKALVSDFFDGHGRDRPQGTRTLFAVGDRKQSIYSFQGADPDEFDRSRALFAHMVPQSGYPFEDITLDVSFRSTAAILQAVDAVFRQGHAVDGVAATGEPVSHHPFRTGQGGLVEIWPPVPATALEEPPPWKPPVERIQGESAPSRLARLLARRIQRMTNGSDRLESQGRPVRPGDILVLVRRRSGFVDDLVRCLKDLDVPVAGVDRMVLSEQMAVMDLIALGYSLLLPEDDLTLACVLKGPILGLTEEQLFTVSHGRQRGVSLWRSLREHRDQDPAFASAWATLRGLMEKADFLPPFELFSHILGPLGGRSRLLARLGPDAADPIDEFLNLALTYDRGHPPNLQAFLHWLETGSQDIRRDLEENDNNGLGAVRIMTVHGSKGLQAPVVFLPDTRQVPTRVPALLWDESGNDEHPAMFWPPSAAFREPVTEALVTAERTTAAREYRRLLYVAMTRAEDRLYICGWDTRRESPEDSWYNLIQGALAPLAETVRDPFLEADGTLETPTVLRLSCPQDVPPRTQEHRADAPATVSAVPSLLRILPAAEPIPSRPLMPSRPPVADPPATSPLLHRAQDENRRQRGKIIHTLLQYLPERKQIVREHAARAFLSRPIWGLDPAEQDIILQKVMSVLNTPTFSHLFGLGSLAEVPVSGVIGKTSISGVIDRLLVEHDTVTAVDFKSGHHPPQHIHDVPEAYLFQMAAYRAVLRRIWPERDIQCALLWTEDLSLMTLPCDLLDAALPTDPQMNQTT
ncbi:double-strand break repair helicase AddA [Haematospirillum jordaniae]|uniref:DNA 3'-5' helicase n=1 Tax=Haematospirillum jordaniae TaxID=1549855 RepID=A0A143DCV6_9PROT|nr:double-strand break repair helicase AddA [Haematospirillum jordaniae]AMW34506.1 DNA helicase UvrD [Haematospirillum jordaniae]NKD57861.1 double-strand break repair helicase AddA [Haematospirillum jordaniae]NKD59822.1 double-strand break repair helicase AddA [Haematospirillum jordaniae]NKD67689.1 double-strand break repair helicase AddA [Haematospirillum jordaniae]NKD79853.1 double-strand break repair helicase AddA [Haematospirillum jordaniae]